MRKHCFENNIQGFHWGLSHFPIWFSDQTQRNTLFLESTIAKFGHIFLMCKSDVIVQWCQKHECQSTVFTFVTLFALFMNTSQVIFQAFAITKRLFTKWTFTSSYFLHKNARFFCDAHSQADSVPHFHLHFLSLYR